MRILFVAPYPASRIRLRSYGFITHLAKLHTVELFTLCANTREMADARALQQMGIQVTAIYEPHAIRYLRGLGTPGSNIPLQVAFDASARLRTALRRRLRLGQVDLLHVEMLRSLGALPEQLPVPVVWDAVDCISRLYELGAQARATRMLRLIGQREAQRAREYEWEHLQRFQHVLVTAEREREALLQIFNTRGGNTTGHQMAEITVVPHGVDQVYFAPYRGTRQLETLVFSGKMSFHANIAGLKVLVEETLPLLWQKRPQIRLLIAGSDPPEQVRRYARDSRIEVTGYLPDLRPAIAQAQIAVCPLPYAVGIQSKVIEAMALGTPVIASTCVAEGLKAVDRHDLLIADEPQAVVQAILSLLDDRQLWNSLAEQGVRYIAAHHNWDLIIQHLIHIYEQAIAMWQGGTYAQSL